LTNPVCAIILEKFSFNWNYWLHSRFDSSTK